VTKRRDDPYPLEDFLPERTPFRCRICGFPAELKAKIRFLREQNNRSWDDISFGLSKMGYKACRHSLMKHFRENHEEVYAEKAK
jgi:hypothetical protein